MFRNCVFILGKDGGVLGRNTWIDHSSTGLPCFRDNTMVYITNDGAFRYQYSLLDENSMTFGNPKKG